MVFDPTTQTVKWHKSGPWLRQHDPDFTANGTISVFNNNADATLDGSLLGGSNIMEVDPLTDNVSVTYGENPEHTFFSDYLGKHQYTEPNENILITD